MTECKTYPLSLSRSYVEHWGMPESVREFIQNALDSESPFEYAFEGDALTITSRYASLSPRTLLLGATSKAGNADAIGSFGEGYKLGLLVLTRLGFSVVIHNGAKLWTPAFELNDDFGEEMLVVKETEAPFDNQSVEFKVSGLTFEHQEQIRSMCLFMQPAMDDVIGTELGSILPSRPGQLYVGGLFVCKTDMAYGYDMLPSVLRLERDRQTVASYEFELGCARTWLATGQWELIARLMEKGIKDVEDVRFVGIPDPLKDACAKRYIKRYGDAVPVSSQKEAEDRNAAGARRTAYVGASYGAAITSSRVYKESGFAAEPIPSPRERLEQWFEDNKRYMPRIPKVKFKQLHEQAARWKLA